MCPTGPGVFNFNFILMRAFLKSLREIGVSKFVLSESLSGSAYCRNRSVVVGHVYSCTLMILSNCLNASLILWGLRVGVFASFTSYI